jgi:hypothetical protein
MVRFPDCGRLGPGALKAVGQAFDEAWNEIAGNFNDSILIEGARLSLANALLSIASDDSGDVQVLKQAALQVMANRYTSLPFPKAKVDK